MESDERDGFVNKNENGRLEQVDESDMFVTKPKNLKNVTKSIWRRILSRNVFAFCIVLVTISVLVFSTFQNDKGKEDSNESKDDDLMIFEGLSVEESERIEYNINYVHSIENLYRWDKRL
jgi:hypothetical protein